MSYLDESLTKLTGFEGCVPYMYLDTTGNVTVGVGRMLASVNDAVDLPFAVSGRAATLYEISADFARVKAMKSGLPAREYRCSTSPVLDSGTIEAMLEAKLDEFDRALKTRLPGYVQAPDVAKVALLDMAYNLGIAGLLGKFPHFCAAVDAGEWQLAAAHCQRIGPNAERNEWTKEQFLAAEQAA